MTIMNFIYPCRPNRISANSKFFDELDKDTSFIAEVKKNGWRCMVIKEKGEVGLWSSDKRLLPDPLPGIREAFQDIPDDTMFDGELIFTRRVKNIPDAFYLFDVLVFKGKELFNEPFLKRRGILEIIHKDYLATNPLVELARQVQVGKKALYYQSIQGDLNEGIVMKKLTSTYPISYRARLQNPHWLKVKKTEKHLIAGGG